MIPNIDWEPPEIFSKDTVVKDRNFRNTTGADQAAGLNGAKVTFQNCKFLSNSGTSIMSWGGSSPELQGCEFYADPAPNQQYAKINIWGAKSFVIEHCKLEHTGGILVEQWQGNSDAPLLIRYNSSLNVDKRRGDGSTGDHRAFIQISTIKGLSQCEVAWNQSINEPGKSYIEDNINIFNSRGESVNKPFLIHDNYIEGAYPFDLVSGFTGSGITVDGTPDVVDDLLMSAFVKAYGNIVIRCGNACMNIAAGHDISYYDNDMVSCGAFPDGSKSNLFWGACCIWDASNAGTNFKNNTIKGNRIGYVRPDQNVPLPGRNDYVTVNSDVRILPTDNTHLPNPITKADEDVLTIKWQGNLKASGITIGPGTNTTTMANQIKVGQTAQVKLVPKNAAGVTVGVKSVSMAGWTKAVDIYTWTLKPMTPAKMSVIITYVTASGVTKTKTFDMEVLPVDVTTPSADNEAVDLVLTFSVN